MTDRSEPVFIGWPTEGVMYWNAFWRGPRGEQLLADTGDGDD